MNAGEFPTSSDITEPNVTLLDDDDEKSFDEDEKDEESFNSVSTSSPSASSSSSSSSSPSSSLSSLLFFLSPSPSSSSSSSLSSSYAGQHNKSQQPRGLLCFFSTINAPKRVKIDYSSSLSLPRSPSPLPLLPSPSFSTSLSVPPPKTVYSVIGRMMVLQSCNANSRIELPVSPKEVSAPARSSEDPNEREIKH